MAKINIDLEGRFIDSFIYSGVLFTVDVHGVLCTYGWKELVNGYLRDKPSLNYLKKKIIDCRESNFDIHQDVNIVFDQSFLRENQKGICCDLGVWSTDLDIKDNILYISSERGLEALPLQWDSGKVMNFNDLYPVWKEDKVFGVTTGTWGRTILAAGSNGAIEVLNPEVEQLKKIGLKQQTGKRISHEICIGCEWNRTSTIAVLDNLESQEILEYKKIKSDYSFKEENFDSHRKKIQESEIEEIRSSICKFNPISLSGTSHQEMISSWFDEDNKMVFGVNNENVVFYLDFSNNQWIESYRSDVDDVRIRKIRKTRGATIIESDDTLYKMNHSSSKQLLASDFVNWRVFPKSKNYQDRIHIVNEEFLRVSIF